MYPIEPLRAGLDIGKNHIAIVILRNNNTIVAAKAVRRLNITKNGKIVHFDMLRNALEECLISLPSMTKISVTLQLPFELARMGSLNVPSGLEVDEIKSIIKSEFRRKGQFVKGSIFSFKTIKEGRGQKIFYAGICASYSSTLQREIEKLPLRITNIDVDFYAYRRLVKQVMGDHFADIVRAIYIAIDRSIKVFQVDGHQVTQFDLDQTENCTQLCQQQSPSIVFANQDFKFASSKEMTFISIDSLFENRIEDSELCLLALGLALKKNA